MKSLINCLVFFFITATLAYSSSYEEKSTPEYPAVLGNILEVLEENGLTTFLDLAIKTGVAETLLGPGLPGVIFPPGIPLFAPTNAAFAALGPKKLKSYLENPQKLKELITYHTNALIPQMISSIRIEGNFLRTSQATGAPNEPIRYNRYGQNGEILTINGALRLKTLRASNGVIYVIDRVLELPPPLNSFFEVLKRNGNFTILLGAFVDVGFVARETTGPFTLFAPTDDAFRRLPRDLIGYYFTHPNEFLWRVINNHWVSGTFYSRGLTTGPIPVFSGGTVDVVVTPGGITFGGANVVKADLSSSQGVIHAIDEVILTTNEGMTDTYYADNKQDHY
ncbi:transforming growth factor-beta-induced protein ig-h3-like [Daphnia pulicaria]|uniref:transforming growth factor-beta-induced protein ig-h3-like n=1 Tax=Daphnia pulicaria TaxID=35523 RepID=UPI001EEC6CDE|nr:transforming growth factor-beta-induced protein ig-h3-like [Daphnia pulicaria]